MRALHPLLQNNKFELLRHLTSNWEGDTIDEYGLIRILNRDGSRAPLIWCFNAQNEFQMMAAGLGPDQPVIGMRSLNLVERVDGTKFKKEEDLADFYAGLLLGYDGHDLYAVGGNCQGAGIAIRLASNLLLARRRVHTLITMEANSPFPFPGRAGLIFGAQSHDFNPFLRGEAPEEKWARLFTKPLLQIVPGGHGQYFTEENCPALCQAIRSILDDKPDNNIRGAASVDKESFDLKLRLAAPPVKLQAAAPASVNVQIHITRDGPETNLNPIVLYYLWTSAEHGVCDRNESHKLSLPPDQTMFSVVLPVVAPDEPGHWNLHVYPCREGDGPISWAANYLPKGSILIEANF